MFSADAKNHDCAAVGAVNRAATSYQDVNNVDRQILAAPLFRWLCEPEIFNENYDSEFRHRSSIEFILFYIYCVDVLNLHCLRYSMHHIRERSRYEKSFCYCDGDGFLEHKICFTHIKQVHECISHRPIEKKWMLFHNIVFEFFRRAHTKRIIHRI